MGHQQLPHVRHPGKALDLLVVGDDQHDVGPPERGRARRRRKVQRGQGAPGSVTAGGAARDVQVPGRQQPGGKHQQAERRQDQQGGSEPGIGLA